MYLLFRWLVSALALLAASNVVPGIHVRSLFIALVVAFILGLLNAVVRPVLVLLTLPITVLTLGLFTFVINALLFWFVSSFVKGFEVDGFWAAFWGALLVALIGWLANSLITSASQTQRPTYRAWWN